MAPRYFLLASTLVLVLSGCGDSEDPSIPDAEVEADASVDATVDATPDAALPFRPDLVCPGADQCPTGGDPTLFAAATRRDITPSFDGVEVLSVDMDNDGILDVGDGDTYEDLNGNGRFDGLFLAGFRTGRSASAVRDPQWARVLVLRQHETTIAFVSIDTVGWFLDDTDRVREAIRDLEVDYLLISATHNHQAKDTTGLWGPSILESGYDEEYQAQIRDQIEVAIREAHGSLQRSTIQYQQILARDLPGGILRYFSDTRDPKIIDDSIRLIRFIAADQTTIGTMINFGSHPEYLGGSNTLVSSDFPHVMRNGIEEGISPPGLEPRAGLGGVAVYMQGAVGGNIGPFGLQPESWEGEPLPRTSEETMVTVGEQLAYHILGALGEDGGSVIDETAALGVRNRTLIVDVENRRYHAAILAGLFERASYNWDENLPVVPGTNEPDVRTEIAVIDIGRAQFITAPGELDPALFLGGYDGSFTPEGAPIIEPDSPNPPNLAAAPAGPYLRDRMRSDAEYVGVFGLGNDFLGYLIPPYNFQLDEADPYWTEPAGDHYEETNSIGEGAWPMIESEIIQLLEWAE
ncbi:MAG: neutral/alkaline non-lysosomal ceramidase N-terminal domain-containing protein [Myxococcota bacterium]